MPTRCLGGFSVTWVPKLLLPLVRIRIFGPKRPNLVQNMHFWSFWAKHWHFITISSHSRPDNNLNKVPMGFFCCVGTKLLLSPVRIRVFRPKTTKFGPKLVFLVNFGQAMQAYSVPCWWVGWWLCRAGCISQDTYLLYMIKLLFLGK